MAEDTPFMGSPVTLAELRALGEFVRWQDIGRRVIHSQSVTATDWPYLTFEIES